MKYLLFMQLNITSKKKNSNKKKAQISNMQKFKFRVVIFYKWYKRFQERKLKKSMNKKTKTKFQRVLNLVVYFK